MLVNDHSEVRRFFQPYVATESQRYFITLSAGLTVTGAEATPAQRIRQLVEALGCRKRMQVDGKVARSTA